MSLKSERRGIHVDQSELLCKKGCGYYGNPAWQGFCSKCWREEYHKARQKQIQEDWELAERLQREEEEAFASSQSSQGAQSLTFSKFEEKKTNEKTRKVTTVKKFFSASSRVGAKKAEIQEAKAPSPSINRQTSIETDRVSKEFIEFLKTFHKTGQEIYKQTKLFLEAMHYKRDLSIEEQSECTQDFYQNVAERMQTRGKVPPERVEKIMDQIEKYIMTRLYKYVFCPETTDDEKKEQLKKETAAKVTVEQLMFEEKNKAQRLQTELDVSEQVQRDFVKLSQTLQVQLERIRQADSLERIRAILNDTKLTDINQLPET